MKAELMSSQKRDTGTKVVFEFFAAQAKKVAVAGSFNGWDASKNPLKKEKDGKWKTQISLASGRYEYRFWVDGVWENDQRPVKCVPNSFGTWNCVIEIK